jgi:hypothetical protein
MNKEQLPPEFLELLKTVKGKRSRVVVEHILEHGSITTEDLERTYGYKHPPRAVRDVREQGIPLETFSTKSSDGRTIAAYRFGDPSEARYDRPGGRKLISKEFKQGLVERSGRRCVICTETYEERYLQVDHRVPYEIAGDIDSEKRDLGEYMLLCGSCNRAKSWSCEHCKNWLEDRSSEICETCYWANPETYTHVAMQPIRRLDIVWSDEEVETFDQLKKHAELSEESIPIYVKAVLARHLKSLKAKE